MRTKLLSSKIVKFLVGGGVAAALNLALIYGLIEWVNFDTPFLRNVANAISIEISLLFSFFIYRIWVWPGGAWTLPEVLFRQLPLYHVAAGTAVIARIFLIFPLLDWLGINYAINTLAGVLISASLNYLISDRLVFKNSTSGGKDMQLYHPEGLAPGLEGKHSRSRSIPEHSTQKIRILSIVIPAYNEENCIIPTIDSLVELLEREKIAYEILIVNDNSRDRTEEILQQLVSSKDCVRYVNNYYPNGFGFAVRCGLENFRGDAVAVVMADSSDSPEDLVKYYYKLQEGFDCIFGSRFISGGKVIDYPTHKLIVNRLANLFIKIIFGFKFNDTTNAFKIYRREVIEGISPLLSHHFNLTVEMPLKAIIRGYSYATVPITWRNRAAGVSKLKLKEMGSRYLFVVLSIWLEKHLARGDYVRKRRPLVVGNQRR